MKSYRAQILGISEVKKKGSGELQLDDNFCLIYSVVPKGVSAKEGERIIMTHELFAKVEEWQPISSRIIVADIQPSIGKVSIIQVYAPTEDANVLDKELFYSDLKRVTNRSRNKRRNVIIMGDLNVRTGWDHNRAHGTMDPHGAEDTKNENGLRLLDFCVDNDLLIGNSFYPHKPVHKITYSAPEMNVNSYIDYFKCNVSL